MFLNINEEKILKERKTLLEEDERKSKFFYELFINGQANDQDFRDIAGKYTKLKYSNLTLEALINDLKVLNECVKNKAIFGLSIFEENTYNKVKKLYQSVRNDVNYLCENIDSISDFRMYHENVLDVIMYMSNVDFTLYFSVPSVTLNSINILEVQDLKNPGEIIFHSLDEDLDYKTFMNKIGIYREYNFLLTMAKINLAKQNSEEDDYLKENPAHIIEHNPLILESNLFDRKTLLEAKKVMYEHAKNALSKKQEEDCIKAIVKTNLVLK